MNESNNLVNIEKLKQEIGLQVEKEKNNNLILSDDNETRDTFDGILNQAGINAGIGSSVPPFNNYNFLKRKIARIISRLILKVLKIITVNQRKFNISVLSALRLVRDDYIGLNLKSVGLKTKLESKVTMLRARLNNLISEQDAKIVSKIKEQELSISNRLDTFKDSLLNNIKEEQELSISNRLDTFKDSLLNNIKEEENKLRDINVGLMNKVDYLNSSLVLLEERLNFLIKRLGKSPSRKMIKGKAKDIESLENSKLDSFYVLLENNFRGSREEIKRRLKFYIPIVKDAMAGTKDSPVLDVGCGRGEWLELLRENNLVGRGLDSNKLMVKKCKELGLEAIEAEAIDYLVGLSDNSLGAVSGFHLVEHLPFERVIKLLDEVLRVLKSGGLIILETPDPSNVLVGSSNFYIDPTHLKPLPSPLLKLMVESQGFCNTRVIKLHPLNKDFLVKDDNRELLKIINEFFFGSQDYAVVGYKI
jgi:O-antigen chain-terminating methyltransferase